MIVIDRIEGDLAVLEVEGQAVDFPASALPAGAVEGSVLLLRLDPNAEHDIQAENQARMQRLKKRSPMKGGLLEL